MVEVIAWRPDINGSRSPNISLKDFLIESTAQQAAFVHSELLEGRTGEDFRNHLKLMVETASALKQTAREPIELLDQAINIGVKLRKHFPCIGEDLSDVKLAGRPSTEEGARKTGLRVLGEFVGLYHGD